MEKLYIDKEKVVFMCPNDCKYLDKENQDNCMCTYKCARKYGDLYEPKNECKN